MLSWFELIEAANGGVARHVRALHDERSFEGGREDAGFERHILGVIGEKALAKWLGVYYVPAVGRLDTEDGDVGLAYQVKATTRKGGSLIVRPQDAARFPFVLAIVDAPRVSLMGWVEGVDAKVDEFWRPVDASRGVHQAAWFVPQSRLEPMESLVGVIV